MIGKSWDRVRRGLFVLVVLGFPCLLAGCGSRTQPVDGVVVIRGGAPVAQLTGYTVTFESDEQPVGASGLIRADGTFQVGTYQDGDGAVLGKHRIAITPPVPDGDGLPPKSCIDKKYERFATSELAVTIAQGRNEVKLEVDPAPRRE